MLGLRLACGGEHGQTRSARRSTQHKHAASPRHRSDQGPGRGLITDLLTVAASLANLTVPALLESAPFDPAPSAPKPAAPARPHCATAHNYSDRCARDRAKYPRPAHRVVQCLTQSPSAAQRATRRAFPPGCRPRTRRPIHRVIHRPRPSARWSPRNWPRQSRHQAH